MCEILISSGIATVIVAGIFTGVLAWLKSQLKHDNDVYLVRLQRYFDDAKQKTEQNLELARLERQIQFAGSYQKILEAIIEIHEKLEALREAIENCARFFLLNKNDINDKEFAKDFFKIIEINSSFDSSYRRNRLLLSEKLDQMIMDYQNSSIKDMFTFLNEAEKITDTDAYDEIAQKLGKVSKEVSKESEPILTLIRQEFRSILGTNDVPK